MPTHGACLILPTNRWKSGHQSFSLIDKLLCWRKVQFLSQEIYMEYAFFYSSILKCKQCHIAAFICFGACFMILLFDWFLSLNQVQSILLTLEPRTNWGFLCWVPRSKFVLFIHSDPITHPILSTLEYLGGGNLTQVHDTLDISTTFRCAGTSLPPQHSGDFK